jgi:hypothetical protein
MGDDSTRAAERIAEPKYSAPVKFMPHLTEHRTHRTTKHIYETDQIPPRLHLVGIMIVVAIIGLLADYI